MKAISFVVVFMGAVLTIYNWFGPFEFSIVPDFLKSNPVESIDGVRATGFDLCLRKDPMKTIENEGDTYRVYDCNDRYTIIVKN